MRYKAAVFDMDGTVLDTLEDLKDAVNYVMRETGHSRTFSSQEVRYFFGSGVTVAITRALACEKGLGLSDILKIGTPGDDISPLIDAGEVKKLQEIYRPYYAAHCDIKTGPYKGIPELLRYLRDRGVRTAVVSNKPDEAVRTLAQEDFPGMFEYVLGEKPGIRRKPAPDMTWKVIGDMGIEAQDSVYIGDSETDIETARASGMPCISVTWGFRDRSFLIEQGAVMLADTPEEAGRFILGDSASSPTAG